MSIAGRAPHSPASRLHSLLAADSSRVLLVAANAAGALCIVTGIFGWAGLGDELLLDGLAFETLIILSTALFTRSALAQPGRWRRPWLVIAAGLLAVLVGQPDGGPLPDRPRLRALPIPGGRLLPRLLPAHPGGAPPVPQGGDDEGGGAGLRAGCGRRPLRDRNGDRVRPHHPDPRERQRRHRLRVLLRGAAAGRRAARLRPGLAGDPPPVAAAGRQHGRARRRPAAPAGQRLHLQLPEHRWRRQRRPSRPAWGRCRGSSSPGRATSACASKEDEGSERDITRAARLRLPRRLRRGHRRVRRPPARGHQTSSRRRSAS